MSQHPSLRSSEIDKKHRSVLKRYERIKTLQEKDKWKEGDSVYGLAKVKILRFKIKKEKAAAAAVEGAEGAVAEGAAAASATAGAEKGAAAPKAAAAKAAAPKAAAPAKEGAKGAEAKKEAKK